MTSILTSLTNYYSGQGTALQQLANAKSSAATNKLGIDEQSNSADAAYLLNLSPQARQYLADMEKQKAAVETASKPNTSGFALNSKQQQQVVDILSKYKGQPETKETFKKIQADFAKAGLAPHQLEQKDVISSFSAVRILTNALRGDYSDSIASNQQSAKTKSAEYLKSIVAQWKAVNATKVSAS
jgi:hypothetical protein